MVDGDYSGSHRFSLACIRIVATKSPFQEHRSDVAFERCGCGALSRRYFLCCICARLNAGSICPLRDVWGSREVCWRQRFLLTSAYCGYSIFPPKPVLRRIDSASVLDDRALGPNWFVSAGHHCQRCCSVLLPSLLRVGSSDFALFSVSHLRGLLRTHATHSSSHRSAWIVCYLLHIPSVVVH